MVDVNDSERSEHGNLLNTTAIIKKRVVDVDWVEKYYMWQKMISQSDDDVNIVFKKNFKEKTPDDIKITVRMS